MNDSKYNSSSQYDIASIMIESNINGDKFELLYLYDGIEITESMYNPFIYGRIFLTDTNGLIESLPIVGEETIRFKIKKAVQDKKYFEVRGQIYKISDRKKDFNRKGVESYTLEFISPNSMSNQIQRVSKTYEGLVSDAIQDIGENFLGLKRIDSIDNDPDTNNKLYQDMLIETTMEYNKINVPNLRPVEAINFLTKFSYSQNGSDKNPYNTTYRFYQTRQGFFYQSIEKAISDRKSEIKHKFLVSNDPNIKTGESLILKSDLFSVIEYNFQNLFDNFKSSSKGYYGGTNLGYDTLTKSVHEYKLNYKDRFDDVVHIDKANTNNEDFSFGTYPYKTLIQTLPTKKGSYHSQYIYGKDSTKDIFYIKEEEIDILKTVKKERYNESVMVEILIPSNIFLNVNDIVQFKFPSYKRETNGDKKYLDDKYYSGNYLVVGIVHILSDIKLNDWKMRVRLLKDSLKSEIK